ncbi:hypothetical protein N8498_01900 [Candidatus Pseudothioglobus singularis]|nr:hypothetical protein [Candidatus Pseudothioglobus singularis]
MSQLFESLKKLQKKNVNLATPMIGEIFELNAIPKKSWWKKLRN